MPVVNVPLFPSPEVEVLSQRQCWHGIRVSVEIVWLVPTDLSASGHDKKFCGGLRWKRIRNIVDDFTEIIEVVSFEKFQHRAERPLTHRHDECRLTSARRSVMHALVVTSHRRKISGERRHPFQRDCSRPAYTLSGHK